ncbi:triose-phosphate isomerase [Candidatus Wolfebacteria bacterium]|nr:triose-phosphate isomerase [Candidatus Wolfebacteria bacterium]
MRKLIVFNWKMGPPSLAQAKRLLTHNLQQTIKNKNGEIVICPPFIYLSGLSSVVSRQSLVKLGAQDVFWENRGAYTGEISPAMLKNSKVDYVIVGHSERRRHLGETDEMINKKVLAALRAGFKVILCVGEPARELRIKNNELRMKAAKNYVKNQLERDLRGIHNSKFIIRNSLIVAYEPIWAIGTGVPAEPENVREMIQFIKKLLITNYHLLIPKVLYGGSVDSRNIADFLKYPEIDGALVGGASLKSAEVRDIIKIVSKHST